MNYIITRYNENHKQGIAEVLTDLWGGTTQENIVRFEVKYENNSYSNNIYLVVALFEDKVVGFRGFVPTKWVLNNEELTFLLVSDASVHKEHRRKGLFKKMTLKAIELFQKNVTGYLNLSSNKLSSPGYLKMGWQKIGKRDFCRFTNIWNLITFKLNVTKQPRINDSIKIINKLDNDSIQELTALRDNTSNTIKLLNKEEFYSYKLLRNNYKSFLYYDNNELVAYATINDNKKMCTIVDFEFSDKIFFLKLLKELRKHYFIVSVWRASIQNIGIKTSLLSKIINKIEEKKRNDLLYRPSKLTPTKNDFYIANLNFLNENIWHFKQLYSE